MCVCAFGAYVCVVDVCVCMHECEYVCAGTSKIYIPILPAVIAIMYAITYAARISNSYTVLVTDIHHHIKNFYEYINDVFLLPQ